MLRRHAGCAITAFICSFGVGVRPAAADDAAEIRALKQEVAAERAALARDRAELAEQRRRIDDALVQLQDNQSRETEAGGDGAAGMPPVSAEPTSKGEKRLEIYGFAQVDGIYDFNRMDPDWAATERPSKIPVICDSVGDALDAGCGRNGETIVSVRQSRLGFRGFLPTALGELKTIFEFDFFGVGDDAGETTIRLRHAWGQLGEFGGGQTNSLFMDGDVFPNTIDYWGPIGMVFLRNPQIRWTPVLIQDERWRTAIALESPGSGLDSGKVGQADPTLADTVTSWNLYPDFTAQVRFDDTFGHVQLAGIVRGLGFEGETALGDEVHAIELGGGVNLSGAFNVFESDQILAQVVYGVGIANYMNDGGTDIAPDSTTNPEAEAVPTLGWLIYYNRTWNERWTSSVGYSQNDQHALRGQTDAAFESGQYFSGNLLFHPVPEMLAGPEFIWGRRKNKNGDAASDSRIQFSLKYDFGAAVLGGR